MQIKIFTLSVYTSTQEEEEVNKFLRSHRVMTIDRQFTPENGGYWTLMITYQENGSPEAPAPMSRSNKKDYREVLTDDQFARFARMKDIRRELSKQENVPAYAIFTDEELSQIAQQDEVDMKSLKSIKGIGKRAEKYGKHFINLDVVSINETSGTPY